MKSRYFFSLVSLFLIMLVSATYGQGVRTIIIDPGHGGKFPGAICSGVKEKDLNLAVALKLGDMLSREMPSLRVVFTRKTDIALSSNLAQDLHARTMIANKASGDLFISIHANAATNSSAYGAETILMGESSVEQQRNEAALYAANREELLDMSDKKEAAIVRAYIQNLQFTYGQYSEALARLIQKQYKSQGRSDRGLRYQLVKVLYGTDMPCALTEIGFMSNPKELTYMKSKKGQEEIARAIFTGIKEYVDMVNKTISTAAPQPSSAPKATPTPSKATPTQKKQSGYTIQILSSTKAIKPNDSQFKSYKGKTWCQQSEGRYRYRYFVGKYATKQDAERELKKVRKSFKDAYITTY